MSPRASAYNRRGETGPIGPGKPACRVGAHGWRIPEPGDARPDAQGLQVVGLGEEVQQPDASAGRNLRRTSSLASRARVAGSQETYTSRRGPGPPGPGPRRGPAPRGAGRPPPRQAASTARAGPLPRPPGPGARCPARAGCAGNPRRPRGTAPRRSRCPTCGASARLKRPTPQYRSSTSALRPPSGRRLSSSRRTSSASRAAIGVFTWKKEPGDTRKLPQGRSNCTGGDRLRPRSAAGRRRRGPACRRSSHTAGGPSVPRRRISRPPPGEAGRRGQRSASGRLGQVAFGDRHHPRGAEGAESRPPVRGAMELQVVAVVPRGGGGQRVAERRLPQAGQAGQLLPQHRLLGLQLRPRSPGAGSGSRRTPRNAGSAGSPGGGWPPAAPPPGRARSRAGSP